MRRGGKLMKELGVEACKKGRVALIRLLPVTSKAHQLSTLSFT